MQERTIPKSRDRIRRLSIGDTSVITGGFLVFAASFLPFVSYREEFQALAERSHVPSRFTAWDSETFMAPLTIIVALAGLVTVVLAVTRVFSQRELHFGSFTLPQIELACLAFAAVCLLSYTFSTKSMYFGKQWAQSVLAGYEDGIVMSIGGYIMVLGAVLGLIGGIHNVRQIHKSRV